MERTPNRQFLMWMEWLGQQWNKPSRSDYYLMQIAQEVHAVLRQGKGLLEYKLPFGEEAKKAKVDYSSPEQVEITKSDWRARAFIDTKNKKNPS